MQEAQQKKSSFIRPALASKDSATKGFTPPRFPVQPQAKPPSKATRAYSSDQRDLIQAKLLEGMDKAIQKQAPAEAIQPKCAKCEAEDGVQLKDDGESVQQKSPQDIAADGFTETPRQLPHLDKIQKSFGQDMSHVQAFIGGKATTASVQLGAAAYTSENRIAFAKTPSLGLAAHEAAHVVQQQSGKVQLKDGLGQVGDKYEQHADAVADAVVAGKSAEPLLGEYTGVAPPLQKEYPNFVQGEDSQSKFKLPMFPQTKTIQHQPMKGEVGNIQAQADRPATSFQIGQTLGVNTRGYRGWQEGTSGWVTALDESGQRISLPDYLKVKYEGFRQGRDYFESLEGHEEDLYRKKLSLAPGYLDDTMTWGGSADLTYTDMNLINYIWNRNANSPH
ncbi:MAG: DUF4157 domain-containing protein [Coleofasciculus sp. C1-SOL-03]|jgi:hypothetical protein|uniref:eCIS core domain-containing protein n=1 Tax=Coleofasciculus sp. C1-SOL-03 TaxID=3069522 RepID=UPI0032FE33D3